MCTYTLFLYGVLRIYVCTVNPQLSEPRLSGSSIIRITKSPCTWHVDYAIIAPTHIHSIYSLCIFSRTRVFFAWRWRSCYKSKCMYEHMHVYLHNVVFDCISLIRTKCLWHLTNGVWITKDSLYLSVLVPAVQQYASTCSGYKHTQQAGPQAYTKCQ